MKSNFKLVTCIYKNGIKYDVYYDFKSRRYLGINNSSVIKIDDEDLESIIISRRINKKIINDKREHDKQVIKSKRNKFLTNAATFLLVASLVGVNANALPLNQEVYTLENSEHQSDDYYNFYLSCLNQNQTINEDLKNDLIKYLRVLSEYDSFPVLKIGEKLKKANFKLDQGKVDMNTLLLILDYKNSTFINRQLINYVNDEMEIKEVNNIIASYIFNNKELLNKLFAGEDIYFENEKINFENPLANEPSVLAKMDKINKSRIKEIDDAYYVDKVSCEPRNNIFSEYNVIFLKNFGISFIYRNENGKWVSASRDDYYKKLNYFINCRESNNNINNSDDRILYYLYIEALRQNEGIYKNDDLVDYIYNSIVNDEEYFAAIDVIDLMHFLSTHEFNYSKLIEMWDLALYEEAYPLVLSLNECLKIEVRDGNLSKDKYIEFTKYVKVCLEELEEEKAEEFINSVNNSNDNSKLLLMPKREL